MPIKSYLVYPHEGKREQLIEELNSLPVELIPAANNEVIVMVSDTPNQEEDDQFLDKLQHLNSLDHYTLVSGFNDEKK